MYKTSATAFVDPCFDHHAAGVANGGTAIEDAPGVREAPFGKLYLAYLRDPAGNKVCALHRVAA